MNPQAEGRLKPHESSIAGSEGNPDNGQLGYRSKKLYIALYQLKRLTPQGQVRDKPGFRIAKKFRDNGLRAPLIQFSSLPVCFAHSSFIRATHCGPFEKCSTYSEVWRQPERPWINFKNIFDAGRASESEKFPVGGIKRQGFAGPVSSEE
ncbi:hypothetical protein KM043_007856 [Ampulex compressa]|nr:hypothetical protein KM043_007856 [Ampulex compressa]